MLVLCYGMPKSGSTLAFELVRAVLQSSGFQQENLSYKIRGAHESRGRNFVPKVSRKNLSALISCAGQSRMLAAKTHAALRDEMFGWMEAAQAEGKLQIIASYRDPRDICLSLLDSARKSRVTGARAFAGIRNLDKAARRVSERIDQFRRWASIRGALRLDYDIVAFSPDRAIVEIEKSLHIKCERERVKKQVFEEVDTQKNKARRHRHVDELTEAELTKLTTKFRQFIRICEEDDQAWFDECREGILRKLSGNSAANSQSVIL